MSDLVKHFWDSLAQTLRYAAPGFVLFIVLRLLNIGDDMISQLTTYEKIIFALLSGVLIYGLHVCSVFQIINAINRFIILKCKQDYIKKESVNQQELPYGNWGYYLDLKRWERRDSNDAIQKGLDDWYPIIHLLFCSAYIMIIASLFRLKNTCEDQSFPYIILSVGIVSILVAISSDYRATKVELWSSVHR